MASCPLSESCPVNTQPSIFSNSSAQSHNPLWTCRSTWKKLLPDPYHLVKTQQALRQRITVIGPVRLSDHWSLVIQSTINGQPQLGSVANQYPIRGSADVTGVMGWSTSRRFAVQQQDRQCESIWKHWFEKSDAAQFFIYSMNFSLPSIYLSISHCTYCCTSDATQGDWAPSKAQWPTCLLLTSVLSG